MAGIESVEPAGAIVRRFVEAAPEGPGGAGVRALFDRERIHQVKPEGVAEAGDGLPAGRYFIYIAPSDGISIAYADWKKRAWKRYGPFSPGGGRCYEVDLEANPATVPATDVGATQTRLRYVNTDPKRWFAF